MNSTARTVANGLGWLSLGLGAAELLAPRALDRFLGVRSKLGAYRLFGVREILTGVGLLTGGRKSPWLWARVAGDALDLAALGRLIGTRHAHHGNALTATAAVVSLTALDVWAATQTENADAAESSEVHVRQNITIARSPHELYDSWRRPERLAGVMAHYAEVTPQSGDVFHWSLRPSPTRVEWLARYVEDRPGELLRWESLEGDLSTRGSVEFRPAPADRGTEVTLEFSFVPPGGRPGLAVARLFEVAPEILARRSLRRFKSLEETGELPTLEKNPTGRSGPTANLV